MRKSLFADQHRLACRRQHRVLGQYLAMQAWVRGLDCIVLEKRDLDHYLSLERLKEPRVQWVRDDLTPWFPHQETYENSGGEKFAAFDFSLAGTYRTSPATRHHVHGGAHCPDGCWLPPNCFVH